MKKKIAIVAADGIGDFVLMATLVQNGSFDSDLFFFHPTPQLFSRLFPHFNLFHPDQLDPTHFDQIIVQNDHSKHAYRFYDLKKKGYPILFLFPKPSPLQSDSDFLFDQESDFLSNILTISEKIFQKKEKDNGLVLKEDPLRKTSKRVLIHPTSKNEQKNWPIKKFKKIYLFLEKLGYEPAFILSEQEKKQFDLTGYTALTTPTLYEAALEIRSSLFLIGCDSGPGHLASCLKVPTLTLAPNPLLAKIWHPCFASNMTLSPPFKIPRLGGKKHNLLNLMWHRMIPVYRVKKAIFTLLENLC